MSRFLFGSAAVVLAESSRRALKRSAMAAALGLLNDTAQWQAASAAAIRRVERFYTQERMVAAYREIYQAALAANGD